MILLRMNLAGWFNLYVSQRASPGLRGFVVRDPEFKGRAGDVLVQRLVEPLPGVDRGRNRYLLYITDAMMPESARGEFRERLLQLAGTEVDALMHADNQLESADLVDRIRAVCAEVEATLVEGSDHASPSSTVPEDAGAVTEDGLRATQAAGPRTGSVAESEQALSRKGKETDRSAGRGTVWAKGLWGVAATAALFLLWFELRSLEQMVREVGDSLPSIAVEMEEVKRDAATVRREIDTLKGSMDVRFEHIDRSVDDQARVIENDNEALFEKIDQVDARLGAIHDRMLYIERRVDRFITSQATQAR